MIAQVRTGNIYGTVTDEEGNPLPGVTVTLTGTLTAPVARITSAQGIFRFITLAVASDYAVKCELQGFNTAIRDNIIVVLGAQAEINVQMGLGTIEEEITVTAVSPVVSTKTTAITENVTREVLQSLPSARDPWVVLQMAPGVVVDRENVGGSESGQQSAYQAKGGGSDQWIMDGVVITDPAAIASPAYYDFDAFEEVNITTGGADVTIQTGGVAINLVTRRGGNRTTLGGRFYLTDKKFQGENLTDELIAEGVTMTNVVRNIKDYGFNLGGPILKDKLWWWMSVGAQDIKTTTLFGTDDDTLLINYAAKINLQLIPANRFEAFAHIGQKEKWGRSSSYSFPGGWHQTGSGYWGGPVYKLQDEHMFGDNFFVSAKFSYSDAGFNLIPMDDLDQEAMWMRNQAAAQYENTYYALNCVRPLYQYQFLAQYFNDDLFGASHEIKIGVDYANRSTYSYWNPPGQALTRYNYNTLTVDTTGDNVRDLVPGIKRFEFWRGSFDDATVKALALYFSDTITAGRLNLILGARMDVQSAFLNAQKFHAAQIDKKPWTTHVSPTAASAMDSAMPGISMDAIDPGFQWTTLSPRLGLTYDITGDGKTIAKLSYANYAEYMGLGWAMSYFKPGGTGGWMDFWWFDAASLGGNADGIIDATELNWTYAGDYAPKQVFDAAGNWLVDPWDAYGYMWSGFDIDNPQQTTAPRYTVDDVGPMRTHEAILTLERELLPDFGVALDFSYRYFYNFNWYKMWDGTTDASIESQAEYSQAVGTIPATVGGYSTDEAAGLPYYLRKAGVPYRYDRYLENTPDYHRTFMAIEARFNKRLSNKWMFNGSFTFQDQRIQYGDTGYLNPTNLWATDNKIYAPDMGASSGKVAMQVFTHWMVKLSGLYQLPLDFNVSFTFNARQGNPIPRGFNLVDYNAPNAYNQSIWVYTKEFGTERLPTFMNLNLRIEKVITVGDTGRIYLMFDLFNALNSATMNRRYDYDYGTYYMHDGSFSPNATSGLANEILNPRIFRLGLRFQF